MKLSIIVPDGTVCKDNKCYTDLSWEGTPENVRVLQWDSEKPINITTKSVSEIVVDGEISINETSETTTYFGWMEFNDNTPNENINELPSWVSNAESAWEVANIPPPCPAPTPDDYKNYNKTHAISLLQETDWTATIDIADPAYSNPYLVNQNEFLTYRSELRIIALNPPSVTIDNWPVKPNEVWSS